MEGIIRMIKLSRNNKKYGLITDDDENIYYFDDRYIDGSATIDDYHENEKVEFYGVKQEGRYDLAKDVRKIIVQPVKFYTPGYFRWINKKRLSDDHLKAGSGEREVLDKMSEVLYITHVNHHNTGNNTIFPFCLLGATQMLKQYIRGQYEFLLVFSHFDSEDWQQSTIQVAKNIRQRREISDRRPLVNFYILVSNARNLKREIDKMKGGTDAAIIPFTFNEIINCRDKNELSTLIISRFDEYYFENNMLGEENPIEEDTLLFGDRGKIADSVVQRCMEGKHSGIFGLRRSGKSSVLRAVERRFSQNDIRYVHIEARSELEGISSWKMALYDVARKVRICMLDSKQNATETRAEFNERLKLNSTEEDYFKRPSQCFVEDIRYYLQEKKNFVIAIDEVELITYNTATSPMWQELDSYKGFWGALRDAGCSLVICGVNSTINERSTINYKGKTCDNPMYERIQNCAGFSKTYLPSFTNAQTKTMINTLGGYSNIDFSQIYVDINRAFGGQPYAVRQFCAYLFDNVKKYRVPHEVYKVSKATFSALLMEFNNSDKGIQLFDTILQHVAIYRDEYEMLKRIALSPEKYNLIRHEEISLIDHIEKYGLIEYDKATFFVTFNIQAIQDYIRKMSQKAPSDMNNDERRQYIQEKVMICEKKLKKYILNYYTYNGDEVAGRKMIQKLMQGKRPVVVVNKKAIPIPDPLTCKFKDFFDHSKYIIYFSTLKIIIVNNWSNLGRSFQKNSISLDKFKVCMEDLNAGRNDADHYDAEDMSCPDDWEIETKVMQAFCTAYNTMEMFFDSCNL